MRKELADILYKEFPALYPLDTYFFYGFEIADGWFDLIYKLSKDIVAIIPERDPNLIETDEYLEVVDYVVNTVKTKFGGLRFYMSHTTEEMDTLIAKAEDDSYFTCGACGKFNKDDAKHDYKSKGLCKNCSIIKEILE